MRSFLLLLVLFFSLAACQDVKRMEKPDNLIPKEKMVDVLIELALIKGAKTTNRSMFLQLDIDQGKYVWERFDIDSLQFAESSNYYAENYDQYLEIYLEVQKRLETMQVKYDTLKAREQRKLDSLRNLDPDEARKRAMEEKFRDSILNLPVEEGTLLPEPVSREDTID